MKNGSGNGKKRPVPFAIEQNNATGSVSYWQMGDHQSQADKDGTSLAEYVHALYGLIRQGKCQDVLMIGCGGGTLATMLHRVGVRVTIVDVDPTAFAIAQHYFHMPDAFTCHIMDGARFLARTEHKYDAIVLDAYAGEAIPAHLLRLSFFALVKARLKARKAMFLINMIVNGDEDPAPERIGRTLRKCWRNVRILDVPHWECRNAIAVAGAVRGLRRPRLLVRPKQRVRSIGNYLKETEFRDLGLAG